MWYHISLVPIKHFEPRIPKTTYETEDRTINRICVTTNLRKAFSAAPQMGNILKGMLDNGITPIIYIYTFYKKDFKRDEYKTPEEIVGYVADAINNEEYWLLKTPSKVSCKKVYITDALIKKMKDMFGITEYFCFFCWMKKTSTKKENIDLLLDYFQNHEDSDFLKEVLTNENISFRGKMKYLLDEKYLQYEE